MNITIWKVSHGPSFFNEKRLKDYQDKNVVSVHVDTGAKGQSSSTQADDFKNVKKGDFFYLCHGNQSIILFGIFTGEIYIPDDGWTEQKYKLIWSSIKTGSYDDEKKWWTPNDNSSFVRVSDNKLFEKLILKPYFGKTITDLQIISEKMKEIDIIQEKKDLLLSNHNLILTGAPGTGKTYLAKQIAQQIIFGEIKEKMSDEELKQFNEQCGFVQFHPSYDYTDFVEGLRPVQDEAGNVGFERKDGVFKAFCKKAVSLPKNDTIDNFNETWDKLVATLNENNYIDVPFLSNKSKSFRVELNEYGTGLANRTYPNNTYEQGGWISGQSKFFSKDQLYNIYRGLSGVPSGGHDNYRRAIVEEMKKSLGLKPYKEGNSVEKSDKNFVFIIDEINRGEISKIFGELFFSIDPGYRGKEKGKIKTQYQNLIEQGDVFYDGFYVPENVYIIGTMNDIDRSVESMDFAFRRRFAFKEIKADDRIEMLDELLQKDKAIKRMKNLNKAIEGIEGLSTAYHIGPAYFLKLKNYNGNFQQLWENHLDGLLREYLRGMQNADEKIEKLKAAYDNESDSANGQQQE